MEHCHRKMLINDEHGRDKKWLCVKCGAQISIDSRGQNYYLDEAEKDDPVNFK